MPAPSAINDFDVEVHDGSVKLNYTVPVDEDNPVNGYIVKYTNETTGGIGTKENEERIDSVPNLVNNHKYKFEIFTKNNDGTSVASNSVIVTMNKGKTKNRSQNSGITYAIAFIVGLFDFLIIHHFGLNQ